MSESPAAFKNSGPLQLCAFNGPRVLFLLLLVSLVGGTQLGCGPSTTKKKTLDIESAELDISFPTKVDIQYAENFSVTYGPNYKVVDIHFNSANRDIVINQKLLLVQRGTPVPELRNGLQNAWIMEVPLHTVAANDDGEITRLKALGLKNNIIAMGGGAIYDPELRQLWEEKKIASIGYSFHRPPLPEVILSLNPDVLILYSFNQDRMASVEKMRALGINAIPQFAWAESSFLGKAEWLKFSALFFNKEREANELFEKVVTRCGHLMERVRQKEEKKTAFLVYHPSESSDWSAHRNDFYASFLEAAGAINVLADDGPTHAVGMNNEKMLSLAKNADFWIANSTSDENWPPADYLDSFKAYRNGQVFHYQKRTRYEHNAYDWYETPEVRPDLVLEDLVFIFYPELLPGHVPKYFERIELTKNEF
ncbi:ABC transporter substrate-binding protein [Ulvibacterium sp.]|uniref:ABC transporter substrate-binding protein n=1 Tax=Ulvibacterium sp. TaxID=2665914 RepID=UPI0026252AFF|nr:ABC transporter substrate-binding protein [Ulvibacterium sp.]